MTNIFLDVFLCGLHTHTHTQIEKDLLISLDMANLCEILEII